MDLEGWEVGPNQQAQAHIARAIYHVQAQGDIGDAAVVRSLEAALNGGKLFRHCDSGDFYTIQLKGVYVRDESRPGVNQREEGEGWLHRSFSVFREKRRAWTVIEILWKAVPYPCA